MPWGTPTLWVWQPTYLEIREIKHRYVSYCMLAWALDHIRIQVGLRVVKIVLQTGAEILRRSYFIFPLNITYKNSFSFIAVSEATEQRLAPIGDFEKMPLVSLEEIMSVFFHWRLLIQKLAYVVSSIQWWQSRSVLHTVSSEQEETIIYAAIEPYFLIENTKCW